MPAPDNSAIDADTTSQSEMNLQFLESASFWANVAVIIFTVASAVAAYLVLHFSTKLSVAKDAKLAHFQEQSKVTISAAGARAAEANRKAVEAGEGTAKALAEAAGANERARNLV